MRGFGGATLVGNNTVNATDVILNLNGSTTGTTMALTSNGTIGAQTVTGASAAGFKAGNIVLISDSTSKYTGNGYNQELNQVLSVSGGVITLQNSLIGNYATASSATVTLLSAVAGNIIEGFTFILPPGSPGGCVNQNLTWRVIVRECTAVGPYQLPGFGANQSAWFTWENCTVLNGQNLSVNGYGFLVGSSSHNFAINNPVTSNVRENPITNNARHGIVNGGQSINSYDDGWNTHGSGCEHITITGHEVVGSNGYGISIGQASASQHASDIYVTVANCRFVNCHSSAIVVNGISGILSQNVTLIGNQIANCCLAGSGNLIEVDYTTNIVIADNMINASQVSGVTNLIFLNAITNPLIRGNMLINATGSTRGIAYQGGSPGLSKIDGNFIALAPGTGNPDCQP